MKFIKKFLTVLLIQACLISYAQTVTVGCTTSGCFEVDPSGPGQINDVTYIADPANEPAFDNRDFQWTHSSAFTPTNGTLARQLTGNWANVTNSPAKFVKVTVTWHKWKDINDKNKGEVDGYPKQANSAETTVIIKHIAAISSMSIPNGSPSNPNNGASVSIPCGANTFIVSVPTPFTDPNRAVTFTWTLPSGFTGSSTSNTINVTANAGGNGQLKVRAKRTDGSFFQEFLVNVTRPSVTSAFIQSIGPTTELAMCANSLRLYTIVAPNATSFSWTPITTGTIFTPNEQTSMVTLTGKTFFTGTASNACNSVTTAPKEVFFGPPSIPVATVNGNPLSIPNYISGSAILNVGGTNEVGIGYNWQIVDGNGNLYLGGPNGAAGLNSASATANQFVRIEVTPSNQCGTGQSQTFYLLDFSGGYYRMASPNPNPTSNIEIDINDMFIQYALKKIELVSQTTNKKVQSVNIQALRQNGNGNGNGNGNANSNRRVSLDISSLPRGMYYLNLSFEGGKDFTERIILQ